MAHLQNGRQAGCVGWLVDEAQHCIQQDRGQGHVQQLALPLGADAVMQLRLAALLAPAGDT